MRPVLIGMNNPLSVRPEHALWPEPPRCTGWRLWQMLYEVSGASQRDYVRAFERHNLCVGPWDARQAQQRGEQLWSTLVGRRVVVLGQEPRAALWLPRLPPLLWGESRGVHWCSIPHPSGLCRDYNDPVLRLAVGLRLEALASGALTG